MTSTKCFWHILACALAAFASDRASADNGHATAVFLADPQIHNVYGGSIKQEWIISDFAAGVAQRPPELNLLAPYVLTELLSRASEMAGPEGSKLVVMLGDTTNVACSSELDRYNGSIKAGLRPDQLLLAAHGNHDSYLMGTVNSYVPMDGVLNKTMANFVGKNLPVDASWWSNPESDIGGTSWRGACASPSNGLPLNKGQWMVRYAKSLGIELQSIEGGSNEDGYPFEAKIKSGTKLEALNYRLLGRWYPPTFRKKEGNYWDLQRVSLSYLVQAIDLEPGHRLVLIDTSTCEVARGGLDYKSSNAGTHACVGKKQIDDIADIISTDSSKKLVFAGHYPFNKLEEDRSSLHNVMSRNGRQWMYVSAHTHRPRPVEWHSGGVEVNIGSTTDWPMEASVIEFGASVPIVSKAMLDVRPSIGYNRPASFQGTELCRHVDAAEKLAGLVLDRPVDTWESPGTWLSYTNCWSMSQTVGFNRLAAAERKIAERIAKDENYKKRVLEIAASASLNEHRRFNLGDVIGGL